MTASLSSKILEVLPKAQESYYKLVLAVGGARAGKTAAITELAVSNNWPRLNVNLRLSEMLLELTHRQRATRVASILEDVVRSEKSVVVLLDNLELLFAEELAQDPLRLLQSLSRNRAIVAAWPGVFDGNCLTYAEPGHPEARKYQSPQAVIVNAGESDQLGAGRPGREIA